MLDDKTRIVIDPNTELLQLLPKEERLKILVLRGNVPPTNLDETIELEDGQKVKLSQYLFDLDSLLSMVISGGSSTQLFPNTELVRRIVEGALGYIPSVGVKTLELDLIGALLSTYSPKRVKELLREMNYRVEKLKKRLVQRGEERLWNNVVRRAVSKSGENLPLYENIRLMSPLRMGDLPFPHPRFIGERLVLEALFKGNADIYIETSGEEIRSLIFVIPGRRKTKHLRFEGSNYEPYSIARKKAISRIKEENKGRLVLVVDGRKLSVSVSNGVQSASFDRIEKVLDRRYIIFKEVKTFTPRSKETRYYLLDLREDQLRVISPRDLHNLIREFDEPLSV